MASIEKNRLDIVIVNYKSSDYLAGCLAGIPRETEGLKISVTVVDNNSEEDAALEELRNRHQWVRFILNRENLGFSRACNQGLANCASDLCLLLNPDTVVSPGVLGRVAEFLLRHPEAGIAGCRILNPDGSEQRAGYRSIPTPASALLHFLGMDRCLWNPFRIKAYHPAIPAGNNPCEAEAVSGSFLMFKRKLTADIGLLDEDFFMYGEDLDFCYRAMRAGWKTYYLPEVSILHHKRVSSSRAAESANLHFYQAMEIFFRKHYRRESGWILHLAVISGIRILTLGSRIKFVLPGGRRVGSRG